jgi:transposase
VLRAGVDANAFDPAAVVENYKNLANIESDFRITKTDDLDLRPIHHRLNERAKALVLICMLACYPVWHLRKAWAPMTFTDEHPTQRDKPVGLTVWTVLATKNPAIAVANASTRSARAAALRGH